MFGPLGLPEILFILVLALLIFGPRKLPEIGRTLGKAMGEFRRATSELKKTLDVEMAAEEYRTPPTKPGGVSDKPVPLGTAPSESQPREEGSNRDPSAPARSAEEISARLIAAEPIADESSIPRVTEVSTSEIPQDSDSSAPDRPTPDKKDDESAT